ncbi:N-acetyltransferase ESCO1 isoform X2 [Trichomycterus rosablanca]|uniref:N-acetyltransferase ESCO1 isoform X2 n=1 Tax=Trichomycterus rosablanca TaxID=2290929 RepID=UPI002F355B73
MPCPKRKMQSSEPQNNKEIMGQSLATSDKTGHMSQRTVCPEVPQKKFLVSKRKPSTRHKEEKRQPRRSSRLKRVSNMLTSGKRKRLSITPALSKEPGTVSKIQFAKVLNAPEKKMFSTLSVLKKGSKQYSSPKVKRDKSEYPLSKTPCTMLALPYPVLTEHSYGQPSDSQSEETTLPDKNKIGGITKYGLDLKDQEDPTVCLSVTKVSHASVDKICLQEEKQLPIDPIGKITVSLDARVNMGRTSSAPLQALFVQGADVRKHVTSNTKNIVNLDASESVNACYLQDSIQATEVSIAPVVIQSPQTSDSFLKLDSFEIEHCVVEIETVEEVISDFDASKNHQQQFPDLQELTELKEISKAVACNESTSTLPQNSTDDLTQVFTLQTSSEPLKKQAMNPQARTKARLAALAEEKAAAAKRQPPKQLNILALCEEIADDIASDTGAAKEEETQESIQSDEMNQNKSELDNTFISTVSSDFSPPKTPTEDILEQAQVNAPKKRFFLSHVSIPIKTQEKTKLSRFQKLRQVELMREKLTWTRVKKMKSDQATQDGAVVSTQCLPILVSTSQVSAPSPVPLASERLSKGGPKEHRKALPAVAPPMPNGTTSSKSKSAIEYKPYFPRPKYSPDDFELDEPEELHSKPAAAQQERRMEHNLPPAKESPKISEKYSSIQSSAVSTSIMPKSSNEQEPTSTENVEVTDRNSFGSETETVCIEGPTTPSTGAEQRSIKNKSQNAFGAVTCNICGMLYSPSTTEDETQHLLFHNQFISAVRYVGWKKERILGQYPDGKVILVLPDDPKYALKKVEEIREMVDSDLGFQQVDTKVPSQTKTFLFISNDRKVAGCLIAEHIQEGYRVIEEPLPEGSEGEKAMFERQRAWCCSTIPEPAVCGISRIWVFSMMRRRGIASRMIECLRDYT